MAVSVDLFRGWFSRDKGNRPDLGTRSQGQVSGTLSTQTTLPNDIETCPFSNQGSGQKAFWKILLKRPQTSTSIDENRVAKNARDFDGHKRRTALMAKASFSLDLLGFVGRSLST